jgi:superfamily I DNA and/or RNA helicase
VILSLVRSNERGELGFLTDLRRLNVSITRAKRKLVVVCDVGTISMEGTYARMVDGFKERGRVLRV